MAAWHCWIVRVWLTHGKLVALSASHCSGLLIMRHCIYIGLTAEEFTSSTLCDRNVKSAYGWLRGTESRLACLQFQHYRIVSCKHGKVLCMPPVRSRMLSLIKIAAHVSSFCPHNTITTRQDAVKCAHKALTASVLDNLHLMTIAQGCLQC